MTDAYKFKVLLFLRRTCVYGHVTRSAADLHLRCAQCRRIGSENDGIIWPSISGDIAVLGVDYRMCPRCTSCFDKYGQLSSKYWPLELTKLRRIYGLPACL